MGEVDVTVNERSMVVYLSMQTLNSVHMLC